MAMNFSALRGLAAASTWLLAAVVSAQFTEDFNDQDLTNGPEWSGSSVFIANAGGQLQLNDVVASASYLQSDFAMPTLNNMEWRVQVQQTFAPSSSNYGRVYLVSDQLNLFAALNGYYLQFGEAGALDAVELFQQTGVNSTSVCRGPDGQIAASFTVGVQVKRDASGNWTLAIDGDGGTDFTQVATGTDATWTSSAHLGVQCVYTASNADGFFYDDIYAGPTVVDNTAPTLLSATLFSDTQVDLLFDEALDAATVTPTVNYALSGGLGIFSATLVGPATVRVTTTTPFQSGTTYTITVNNVSDAAGNPCVGQTADFLYFVPDVPLPGDVLINEIMADPTPVVGLPDAEYVELLNATTDKTFDLSGWTYSDGGTPLTLPVAALPPGGSVILTSAANVPALSAFGTAIAPSGSVSLTNTGDPIVIQEPGGTTIDAVTYSDAWYHDAVKALGGWSLERIDPTAACSGAGNWTASTDPQGGTPGTQNSVFAVVPDVTPPSLVNVLVNSDTQVQLVFNEAMDLFTLTTGDYSFEPALSITQVDVIDAFTVQLTFSTTMAVGQIYTVTITGVADCPGNPITDGNTGTFAQPEPVMPGDVVINEVLYDPVGSGSDFVELYNRSGKVLSLANWRLANESGGVIGSATPITSASYLLLPGQYIAICQDAVNIAEQYPLGHSDRYLETDMPSYNNGYGVVVLQDPSGDTLDRFAYDDNLHFELLNSTEGVSLERVSPFRPTDDNTNWHSAAGTVGYATPGYENSQYSTTTTIAGALTIERPIFSPDNDGFEDVLTITYKFDAPGFTGTMKVFDVAGREVKTLLDNALLGTVGSISWNGIREQGDLARMGPYIVMLEAFDLDGNVERFRETVVLAHKVN